MATFKQFEDIKAWKHGRELTRQIYRATRDGAFSTDYALRDQIRRAVISVTSNIAEGFERNSRREFSRFLSIAKGSAGEVRSQLYIALDEGYIDEACFRRLHDLSLETIRTISGLIEYLNQSGER